MTGKMNPEIKARWVAALRSGEYKQGMGVLRRQDGGFCCLGVLADLAAQDGLFEWARDEVGDWLATCDGDNGFGFATLPLKVVNWAELSSSLGPDFELNGEQSSLVEMNDRGCTFAEIADAIESQL